MVTITIFILLFTLAIALDVPIGVLVSTIAGIALMGVVVYKISSLFDKKRG